MPRTEVATAGPTRYPTRASRSHSAEAALDAFIKGPEPTLSGASAPPGSEPGIESSHSSRFHLQSVKWSIRRIP